MRIPPDASPAVKLAFKELHERLDRFGASHADNVDLHGKQFVNAGDAVRLNDFVTLRQLLVHTGEAVRASQSTAGTAGTGGEDDGGGGGGGGGGGPCDPTIIPPPGAECPAWLVTALSGAGATNCWTIAALLAIEGDANTNDFTEQRDSACTPRTRLYHQANHALWGTFCGQPDASAVADYHVDIGRGDGGWTWVVG